MLVYRVRWRASRRPWRSRCAASQKMILHRGPSMVPVNGCGESRRPTRRRLLGGTRRPATPFITQCPFYGAPFTKAYAAPTNRRVCCESVPKRRPWHRSRISSTTTSHPRVCAPVSRSIWGRGPSSRFTRRLLPAWHLLPSLDTPARVDHRRTARLFESTSNARLSAPQLAPYEMS